VYFGVLLVLFAAAIGYYMTYGKPKPVPKVELKVAEKKELSEEERLQRTQNRNLEL